MFFLKLVVAAILVLMISFLWFSLVLACFHLHLKRRGEPFGWGPTRETQDE